MQKLDLNDPDSKSADFVGENIETLKALFPEAVSEGRIDFDVLKQLLGGAVDEREEKYGLTWHGKRRARQIALTPSTGTLLPCPKESVDWDTTQNLMIEGDNLEVLKLLQKSYANKVKLIYIDPPYNTGKDFIYPDDFRDSIRNYLELTEQVEDGRQISTNPEISGRFHTDWLNMMYPRLKLAKNLLHQTGVLLVSCNDKEAPRLSLLLDELLGEENFVSKIVWQRSKKGDAKLIASVHEYVLCYVRDKAAILAQGVWRRPKDGAEQVLAKYADLRRELGQNHEAIRSAMMDWYRGLPEDDPRKAHKHYNWSDDRGLYFPDNFAGPDDGRVSRPRHDILHPVTGKSCKKPSTGWRWDEAKTNWALSEVPPRIHFGLDETTIPNRKSYLVEIDAEPFSSVFYRDGRSATLEVEELVGKGWFPFPKNTDVLAELVELVTGPNDIVLDFFAGSGSTGHAVMNVNAAHRSQRRYILVQLPEPTERDGYRTIADITKKRLAAAGENIQAEATGQDTGFRVFKLAPSNITPWSPQSADISGTLHAYTEHLVPGRSEQDVLYELLLKLGLDLCTPIEKKTIASSEVYAVGAGALIVCLASGLNRNVVEKLANGIVDWHRELAPAVEARLVFKDSGFADDVAKTNMAAILTQHGLTNVRSI